MSFWRKDEPVLDENGRVVAGGMWPTQRSCWESNAYIKAFVGGYGCVAPETEIVTARGLVRIDALAPGEPVLSWDADANQFVLVPSSGGFPKGTDYLYRISTPRGEFVAAGHHRVLCEDGEYQRVDELLPGDVIFCLSGVEAIKPIKIENIIREKTKREYWDMQVPGTNNYVTADGVIHHNSGKSTILAKRSIASALYNAPVPILLVSPSYRMARRTIIPAITHLLQGRRLQFEHKRQDAVIRVSYRGITGEIWIGSADTPDSLKGSNVAACYLDEAFLVDYSAIEVMLSRIRDPNARLRELFMVGTPEGVSNWGYEMIEGNLRDKFDISVHRASTLENKALPKEFIDALLSGYDEKTRKAYVDGEFVDMSGDKALYAFDRNENVMALPVPEGELICAGIDFNYNPFCACLLWIQREHDFAHDGPHIHIFKEVKLEGGADTAEMVRRLWNESGGKLDTFYPDPSGRQHKTSAVGGVTDFTIIQNMGKELRGYPFRIRARRRTPSIRDRYNATNRMLENKALTIDPSCENIIKSFQLHAYGKKYQGEDLSHFVDCSTYVVELENPIINKIDKQRERWY